MPFIKGQSGNYEGRPKEDKSVFDKPTNRDLKERELIMLLRKIKPHIADAIIQAAKIMKNEEAGHHNQLKAATILLDNYRKLTMDVYDGEDIAGNTGKQVQENNPKPAFSLTVLNTNKEE